MSDYAAFLEHKRLIDPATGIADPPALNSKMFPFQADIVRWALRRGRAAIFAGTGLGKSLMEEEWARIVSEHTGKPVLILTPLAVTPQMIREGRKFGIEAHQVKTQGEATHRIDVTNYEKLAHFDPSQFGGVVLDESSILKAFDGKTRSQLIESFQRVPFRLAATATPAPNDFMELGNHAEFLGIMSYTEMLAMFFVHDGGETQSWRLKGHGQADFWRWLCSWAVMLRNPSDLGYDGSAFDLPPLHLHQHTVDVEYQPTGGFLFPVEARTLQERIRARSDTVAERVECAAALINNTSRPWIAWRHRISESTALKRAIPDAVEVVGSDTEDFKERMLDGFSQGRHRVMITSPMIAGFGLNWQRCADMAFVGLNDSWEQVYQAIRRCWRFGQTRPVNVHFIASEIEGAVVANLARKDAQAEQMAKEMLSHMADINRADLRGSTREKASYEPRRKLQLPGWVA